MELEPRFKPVLLVNVVAVFAFSVLFVLQENWEFVLYILVILFFGGLIFFTRHAVNYPTPVLWGLTAWAVLHMAGGGIPVREGVLYSKMLVPLVGEPYNVLKYDQVVHVIGFFVATLVVYYLLEPKLKKDRGWIAVSVVVVSAGLGLGALNEIVEFATTVVVPDHGVGGYENTALDLVADLLGAALAMAYVYWKER